MPTPAPSRHHPAASTPPVSWRLPLLWTLVALGAIVGWDALGADRAFAHWFGSSEGFPLREHWFMVQVMHEGGRRLGWAIVLLLALGVWWPVGFLRRLPLGGRIQLATGTLVSLAVISALKYMSTTSCPWDLAEFGGVARYVSHWALGLTDGGGGHCFPAGHASAGFAFLGGYFALRRHAPAASRLWLAGALASGLVLGLGQQVRGAHFMSHTLWASWLCWSAGWLYDLAFNAAAHRQGAPADDDLAPQA